MKNSTILLMLCLAFIACKEDSLGPSNPEHPITAGLKLADVNSLASSFRLMRIHADSVRVDGCAFEWCYDYLDTSATPPSVRCYHATSNHVQFDSVSALPVGISLLTSSWFDSDSALYYAEHNGGSEFRVQHPSVTIQASLGEDLGREPKPTWWISYFSQGIYLRLEIDANTGALLTQLHSKS